TRLQTNNKTFIIELSRCLKTNGSSDCCYDVVDSCSGLSRRSQSVFRNVGVRVETIDVELESNSSSKLIILLVDLHRLLYHQTLNTTKPRTSSTTIAAIGTMIAARIGTRLLPPPPP